MSEASCDAVDLFMGASARRQLPVSLRHSSNTSLHDEKGADPIVRPTARRHLQSVTESALCGIFLREPRTLSTG